VLDIKVNMDMSFLNSNVVLMEDFVMQIIQIIKMIQLFAKKVFSFFLFSFFQPLLFFWKKNHNNFFFLVNVGPAILTELKRIIEESNITNEDDRLWPLPDRVGRQELEIVVGRDHISFTVIFFSNLNVHNQQ